MNKELDVGANVFHFVMKDGYELVSSNSSDGTRRRMERGEEIEFDGEEADKRKAKFWKLYEKELNNIEKKFTIIVDLKFGVIMEEC